MGFKVGDKVKVIDMLRPSESFEVGETGKVVGIYEYCNNFPISVRMDKDKEVIDFAREELKLYKEEDKLVKFNVEDKVLVKGGNGEARIVRKWILTREGIEFYLDNSSRPYKESELELYKEDKMDKTFQEVIRDIKEGEIWECVMNKNIIINSIGVELNSLDWTNMMLLPLQTKFKLKRKEYTFQEAFAAYEEGKEIQSIKHRYKKINNQDFFYSRFNKEWEQDMVVFDIEEIRGSWYINE